MQKKSLSKTTLKKICLERIKVLLNEAKKRPAYANRYIELARRLAMKVNLRIPREYKRTYCKYCHASFKDNNYRVRTKNGYVVYTCFSCKKYSKYKI
ncbi:MAG TPA: ribonuclease P [Candidatus Nanoarchaeia archaeon]|nr:ribonuclease P [Candidatus Nanoarchaeia archaeon]